MIKIIKIFAVWCPACIIMRDRLKKINYDFEQIEYDYDLDENIVSKYNVDDILPVIIFLKDDIEVKRLIGEKSIDELNNTIKELL